MFDRAMNPFRRDVLLFAAGCALFFAAVIAPAAEVTNARQQFLSGQYTNCIATCREAIADFSYQEEWHELLVKSEFSLGRYEQAGLSLSNALDRFSWSVPMRLLGCDVFPYTSQSNRAPELLEQVAALANSRNDFRFRDAGTVVAVGRAALLLGSDPRRVLDNLYQPVKKQRPDFREVHLAMGELSLGKHDFDLAAKQFTDGLKHFPNDPEMNFGLARAHQSGSRLQMVKALDATLAVNTNHTGATLLLVDHLIDGEEYDEADKLIDRVLGVNPWHPEAWACRAVLRHLQNNAPGEAQARSNALKFWISNPNVDFIIGRKLSQKYRFAEGAEYQRRALRADTNHVAARGQLAQDLLRLGEETEGWRLAEEAHKQDEYDVTLFNLVTLKDQMRKFQTLTNGSFIVRMGTNEAPVYGDEVLALLERARKKLSARYGLKLDRPVTVEIFTAQKDFGVRTFGMPDNPGYLGVCFGAVITANSPATQTAHPANWQAVLWHEFTHVITLQMTRNKMPRWLSEGISVFEELQENPAWGQRMNAQYREMILDGGLTRISDLSSAFLAPKTPMHLQFAYYESALVVEYIVKTHGFNALQNILRDLAKGVEINTAIAAHTAPIEDLEEGFEKFAALRAESLAPGLDWEKPTPAELRSTNWLAANPTNFYALLRTAQDLMSETNWAAAKKPIEELLRRHPGHTGAGSAWLLLAQVHRELGETNAERAALEKFTAIDAETVEAYDRLMEIGVQTGDWKLVRTNALRWLAVNPLLPRPHEELARAAEALKDDSTALRANRVLLALEPADPAQVHFRIARLLHKSRDPEARRQLLQALEEAPRFREAHELLRAVRSGEK
jgi:tetratricopeptide (TPR) repeat protein